MYTCVYVGLGRGQGGMVSSEFIRNLCRKKKNCVDHAYYCAFLAENGAMAVCIAMVV